MGGLARRLGAVVALPLLVLCSRPAAALPPVIDGDDDGHVDAIETALGADPADAASTPESVAVGETCADGLDNDGDGAVDLDDSGCRVPPPADVKFPVAGLDVFESTMTLDAYALALGSSTCLVDFDARGPVVVQRGDPSGEPMPILPVEIVAMQLGGVASVLPGGSGCPLPPGSYDATVFESASQQSSGQVRDTTADPATDFPADSDFNIYFSVVVGTAAGDLIVPGGPPGGPAGDPVPVQNQINTIPPYHGGMNSLCYEVPGFSHQHCPLAPPDHYTCYTAKFAPRFEKRAALLRDQFDETGTSHRVLKPLWFCNPASKNGEPLYEPTGHLKCYLLKPRKLKTGAQVQNQFGIRTVETKRAQVLCLASEKNEEGDPTELDDFKCYTAKFTPAFARRDVTLVDQFGIVQTQVKKPQLLCNPTGRDGQPIRNPLRHLECFRLKPVKVSQTVTVRNDFGDETVATKKAVALCVPSRKSVEATTTTTEPPGTTTTTTLPGGIEITGGYHHPTPGVPPSTLCARIFGPPAAMVEVSASGPGLMEMRTLQLNGSGEGTVQFDIFSFGSYMLEARLGTTTASASVNVGPTQSSCP